MSVVFNRTRNMRRTNSPFAPLREATRREECLPNTRSDLIVLFPNRKSLSCDDLEHSVVVGADHAFFILREGNRRHDSTVAQECAQNPLVAKSADNDSTDCLKGIVTSESTGVVFAGGRDAESGAKTDIQRTNRFARLDAPNDRQLAFNLKQPRVVFEKSQERFLAQRPVKNRSWPKRESHTASVVNAQLAKHLLIGKAP